MLSQNIKALRMQKGLTQKELADLLFVTSQAVSRWENGDVQPSIETISGMAKIFNVTTDEIIYGPQAKPTPEVITQYQDRVVVEQGLPVLTICDHCKRPIYASNEIVTKHTGGRSSRSYYICTQCDQMLKAQQLQQEKEYGISQRKKAFIWGILLAIAVFFVLPIANYFFEDYTIPVSIRIIVSILTFTFTSCMFLNNSFISITFYAIASWGVVKFPGIIFSFDLDGFIFLIGMKILFAVLGFLIGLAAIVLSLAICMPLSLFTYPYSLNKNIKNPEKTSII